MTARRELIVVSNRGPVTFGRDASGNRVARRGGGGLVTALRSLVTHHDVTWVASAISAEDRLVAMEAGTDALAESAADGSGASTITADCTATTFVLIDAQPAAATAPAGAAVTE